MWGQEQVQVNMGWQIYFTLFNVLDIDSNDDLTTYEYSSPEA